MTIVLLGYAAVCLVLSVVLVLIIAVQTLAPLLRRTRSSVEELSSARLEPSLRSAA